VAEGRGRERLYGFDAVRGLAAIAVVALHAAYPYILAPMPGLIWPVPLDEPSRLADACFWWIEGFVMPLFFTISGYFLARSLVKQRPGTVAAGRSRRLVVSFWTVGIVILAVDLLVWTGGFALTGQSTWNDFRRMKFGPAVDDHLWGPAHLWYLEYLWVLCAGTCLALATWRGFLRQVGPVILFSPRLTRIWRAVDNPGFLTCLLATAAAVFLILGHHPEIVLGFQHHFIVPSWPKLVHGGFFLLLGVALFRSPDAIEFVRRTAPFTLAAAVVAFAFILPRVQPSLATPSGKFDPALGSLLAVFAMTAVLGHLGAGLRWFNQPSPPLERLAAASFWIYVAHHPTCGLLQLALRPAPLPPEAKFGVVTVVTLGVCLFTYNRFVAGGPIERMLDGEWPWKAFRRPETTVPAPTPSLPARKAA